MIKFVVLMINIKCDWNLWIWKPKRFLDSAVGLILKCSKCQYQQKSAKISSAKCPNYFRTKICIFQCLSESRAGLAEPGSVRRRTAGKSSKHRWKSSISASSRISASCKFSTRPNSQQPHVLLIPSGFVLLEFKCVAAPRVQVYLNLLWISSAFVSWKVKRGGKANANVIPG